MLIAMSRGAVAPVVAMETMFGLGFNLLIMKSNYLLYYYLLRGIYMPNLTQLEAPLSQTDNTRRLM